MMFVGNVVSVQLGYLGQFPSPLWGYRVSWGLGGYRSFEAFKERPRVKSVSKLYENRLLKKSGAFFLLKFARFLEA